MLLELLKKENKSTESFNPFTSTLGEFKHGAYKFAQTPNVPILSISLEGSYHIYEETGTYHPCHIKVKIHPLVHIEKMDRKEQTEAFGEIEKTIICGWK